MSNQSSKATSHGEFALISDFFNSVANQQRIAESEFIELGIGDDCAIFAPSAFIDKKLVVSTDTLIEGTHFFRLDNFTDNHGAYLAGYRSMVASLSDLAAMGATPIAITLAYSNNLNANTIRAFCDGMNTILDLYQIPLMGGDTTSGGDKLTVTVTVFGVVERSEIPSKLQTANRSNLNSSSFASQPPTQNQLHALQRNQAEVGDLICVTGVKLGAANQALARLYACLEGKHKDVKAEHASTSAVTSAKPSFNWFNFASNWSGIQQSLAQRLKASLKDNPEFPLTRVIAGTDLVYANPIETTKQKQTSHSVNSRVPSKLAPASLDLLNHQLRYYFPLPKLNLGRLILPYCKCGQDISDGLLQDLRHILTAGKVNAELWLDCFPLARTEVQESESAPNPKLKALFEHCGLLANEIRDTNHTAFQALTQIKNFLTSAEEYQLIFTLSPQNYLALQQRLNRLSEAECRELELETRVITAIGRITDGAAKSCEQKTEASTLANSTQEFSEVYQTGQNPKQSTVNFAQVNYRFTPDLSLDQNLVLGGDKRAFDSTDSSLKPQQNDKISLSNSNSTDMEKRNKEQIPTQIETTTSEADKIAADLYGLDYPLSQAGIEFIADLIWDRLREAQDSGASPATETKAKIVQLQQPQEQAGYFLLAESADNLAEVWDRVLTHYSNFVHFNPHNYNSGNDKDCDSGTSLPQLFPRHSDFAQCLDEEVLNKLKTAPGLEGWSHQ